MRGEGVCTVVEWKQTESHAAVDVGKVELETLRNNVGVRDDDLQIRQKQPLLYSTLKNQQLTAFGNPVVPLLKHKKAVVSALVFPLGKPTALIPSSPSSSITLFPSSTSSLNPVHHRLPSSSSSSSANQNTLSSGTPSFLAASLTTFSVSPGAHMTNRARAVLSACRISVSVAPGADTAGTPPARITPWKQTG